MRKYLFLLLAVAIVAVSSVSLVSCGKDDVVHIGNTNIVYSIEGGWSKWLSGSTFIGCRFDSNGDAYFATWTTSPSWENPAKWNVSGSVLTVKSQDEEEEVIFTCNFVVYNEGKSLYIFNVQTSEQWQILNNLEESELTRMKIKVEKPIE